VPDFATLFVLRDLVWLTYGTLVIGLVLYALLRGYSTASDWSHSGNVLTRPYELPDGVLAALVIFLLSGGLIVGGLEASAAPAPASSGGSQQLSAIVGQIVVMLAGAGAVLGYLRFVRGFDPGELFGLRSLRPLKALLFAALAILPAITFVSIVSVISERYLHGVWPDDSPQEIVKSMLGTTSIATRVLMIFAATIVAPLTEEILFRGFLYGVLKRYTDGAFATLISALLFGIVHMHVGSFLPLFVLALLLATAYEMTGSLLVPMIMHALFNALMIVAMFAAPE
jgi:membrane protease YdiL (CAAX protease family)